MGHGWVPAESTDVYEYDYEYVHDHASSSSETYTCTYSYHVHVHVRSRVLLAASCKLAVEEAVERIEERERGGLVRLGSHHRGAEKPLTAGRAPIE